MLFIPEAVRVKRPCSEILSMPIPQSPRWRLITKLVVLSVAFILLFGSWSRARGRGIYPTLHRNAKPVSDKVVVVASRSQESTDWVKEDLPDWGHAIYIVDSPSPTNLTVPVNKGNEAMVYLTYIIDNYHNLPLTMAFIHHHRDNGWHTGEVHYSTCRATPNVSSQMLQPISTTLNPFFA